VIEQGATELHQTRYKTMPLFSASCNKFRQMSINGPKVDLTFKQEFFKTCATSYNFMSNHQLQISEHNMSHDTLWLFQTDW